MIRGVFLVVWSAFFVSQFCGRLHGDELDLAGLQKQIYEVVDKTAPAIVEITRRNAIFSGVIVSPKGHVLTAGHTVEPGQRVSVLLRDGRRLQGRCLGGCEQMRGDQIDCGLIKIDDASDLPFVELGSSANLQVHQPCLSISYPGGQRSRREPLVRFGYINGNVVPGRMIKSTALMEPGDSGGPLFDIDGRLIGIHSRISTSISENFDMPIDGFKLFWDQLNQPNRFYTQNLRPLPKLGFVGEDYPELKGIRIISLIDNGVAKEMGIQPDDYLKEVHGKPVSRLSELQKVLSDVMNEKPASVSVSVLRGDKTLPMSFVPDRLIAPKADRIPGLDTTPNNPAKSYPQLAKLASSVAQLESKLDDCSCIITSDFEGKKLELLGTFISGSSWIVTKNSLVGDSPHIVSGGKRLNLEVVARDESNDLLLLKSPEPNITGVSLTRQAEKKPRQGQFLISPDPAGEGLTSVTGSGSFASRREVSRGYLGVMLEDSQDGGVVLLEVNEGAAQRAGLKIGDVILQVDDQTIKTRPQMIDYLRSLDPNTRIKAKVRRETTEFEMEIKLGAPPDGSGHAADMMEKSLRRDGFASVYSHDAIAEPKDCGGPVFDFEGNFVGINIARHSRVRTFFVPVETIQKLIDLTTTAAK